jgi:hypothetical protein
VTYDEWRHRGVKARLFELVVAPVRDLLYTIAESALPVLTPA